MGHPIDTTVEEIARLVGGSVCGEAGARIRGVASLDAAGAGDVTFLANPRYAGQLRATRATAAVVGQEVKDCPASQIVVANPDLAFGILMQHFSLLPPPAIERVVSERACVAPGARVGANVAIGPFAVVEDGAVLGEGTTVYPGVYVGHDAKIGADCVLHANVTIRERVTLGDRVVIHAGSVVGSDGFGYALQEGRYKKIPQIGTVQIDDDVEVGACATIDRARFDKTHIGRGTKIDNLVMIAHNVVVGEDCCIVCLSGIAGSSTLGSGTVMAAQSGVAMHAKVGERVTIAARGGAVKDVPAGSVIAGFPATGIEAYKRSQAALRRLPKLQEKIRELEKRIEALESGS